MDFSHRRHTNFSGCLVFIGLYHNHSLKYDCEKVEENNMKEGIELSFASITTFSPDLNIFGKKFSLPLRRTSNICSDFSFKPDENIEKSGRE